MSTIKFGEIAIKNLTEAKIVGTHHRWVYRAAVVGRLKELQLLAPLFLPQQASECSPPVQRDAYIFPRIRDKGNQTQGETGAKRIKNETERGMSNETNLFSRNIENRDGSVVKNG